MKPPVVESERLPLPLDIGDAFMSGSVSVAVIGCPTAGWVVDKVTEPARPRSSTMMTRANSLPVSALVVSRDDRHVVHVVPVRVGRGLEVRRFLEHEIVCVVGCVPPSSSVSVRENRPPSAPPRDNVSARRHLSRPSVSSSIANVASTTASLRSRCNIVSAATSFTG